MISLEQDEHIILVAHRHWFIFALRIAGAAFLAITPFVLLGIVGQLGVELPFDFSGKISFLVWAALSAWLAAIWMFLFVAWTNYYLDALVLTNKKLIEIEQRGLFSREVSSFQLSRIQDVTVDIHGVTATLFHFGDIHVQTAGDSRNFILRNAALPYKIKERILEEYRKVEEARV